MRILITGAFGFVGRNLSAYLANQGHELWALDVGGESSEVLKCESSKVEESSSQAVETQRSAYVRRFNWDQLEQIPWYEVDAVVHLAGKAHDTRNASDPQSYFDVNVGLTKKVVSSLVHYCESSLVGGDALTEAQRAQRKSAAGIDRTNERMNLRTNALPTFILFSSVKAVADRVEGILTEEAVPEPKTPYGQSKLAAEQEVLKCGSSKVLETGETTANKANCANEELRSKVLKCESSKVREFETASQAHDNHFRTSELPNFRTYILRPCMIHGPGNKGNLNLLYALVRKGVPWPLGAFENRRSFASIGNVCAVVEGLLAGSAAPGVYQVADDETLSTNELIALMSETMGRKARIWQVPAGLVRAVARVGDHLRLPLNSERLKKLTESYAVSNVKVKRALGWEKMPLAAREGMRKTLESFGERALTEAQRPQRRD